MTNSTASTYLRSLDSVEEHAGFDFVYIDGMLEDIILYSPYLKVGGVFDAWIVSFASFVC